MISSLSPVAVRRISHATFAIMAIGCCIPLDMEWSPVAAAFAAIALAWHQARGRQIRRHVRQTGSLRGDDHFAVLSLLALSVPGTVMTIAWLMTGSSFSRGMFELPPLWPASPFALVAALSLSLRGSLSNGRDIGMSAYYDGPRQR